MRMIGRPMMPYFAGINPLDYLISPWDTLSGSYRLTVPYRAARGNVNPVNFTGRRGQVQHSFGHGCSKTPINRLSDEHGADLGIVPAQGRGDSGPGAGSPATSC